jgi:ankyrin repeat protein
MNGPPEKLSAGMLDEDMGAGMLSSGDLLESVAQQALHEAVKHGDEACVSSLLEHGVGIDLEFDTEVDTLEEKQTALHVSVLEQQLGMCRLLVSKGGKVNVVDAAGCTPLHWAAMPADNEKCLEFCQLLVGAGADATLKDGEGLTPLDYAKEDGDAHDVVAFLEGTLEKLELRNAAEHVLLRKAVADGNMACVTSLLKQGVDINLQFSTDVDTLKEKQTALHVGVLKQQLSMCRLLVGAGSNVNLVDAAGCTPLHRAAMSAGNEQSLEFCRVLVEAGADAKLKDGYGKTPLDYAKEDGDAREVVSFLSSERILSSEGVPPPAPAGSKPA